MYLRTTTLGTNDLMTNYILGSESQYNDLAVQASTGKKVLKPSDDANATVNILNTNTKMNQLNGYLGNMKLAQNDLNVLDDSLASTTTSLQKANDLAVQASNGTCSNTELDNIKTQIDQILENVTDIANTKYNGNYIFSGTKTGTQAYTTDSAGNITYNGTPETGSYQRYVQISDGVKEQINVSGDQVYGSYSTATVTAATASGDVTGSTTTTSKDASGNTVTTVVNKTVNGDGTTTTTTETAKGIVGTLKLLSNALGNYDSKGISASLDSLSSDLSNVSAVRTQFAGVTNRFTMTTESTNNMMTQLKSYKSSLQDADLSEVLTALSAQQLALKATMSVSSSVLSQVSLINYM